MPLYFSSQLFLNSFELRAYAQGVRFRGAATASHKTIIPTKPQSLRSPLDWGFFSPSNDKG